MIQGKCITCHVRWEWDKPVNAKRQGVHCPCCLANLQSTTHLLRWPRAHTTAAAVRYRSFKLPKCNGYCRKIVEQTAASGVEEL